MAALSARSSAPQAKTKKLSFGLSTMASFTYRKVAKKKCCESQPRCTRCTRRNLNCVYNKIKAGCPPSQGTHETLPSPNTIPQCPLKVTSNHERVSSPDREIERQSLRSSERTDLLKYFNDILAPLLVVTHGGWNPIQGLVSPYMADLDSPVAYVIYSMSSAHLVRLDQSEAAGCTRFHKKALDRLDGLLGGDSKHDEALTTIVVLLYYETLFLKYDMALVRQRISQASRILASRLHDTNPRFASIERILTFHDVVASLSLGSAPLLPVSPIPFDEQMPGVLNEDPLLSNVDPLFGLTTDL
ncbi:hypothetical protein NM208_g5407 [Fusarium decemcellulare]|uniref:Uncharacterized protein n=2 Tax=Fusarium decemcellulare TaxID=57161 RepID=A0ACC1SH75_9HYPO|nr:hypothetical protein NM208_g6980 [Fusarium decemcellulare]KAJ3539634.1 hypothetical protein NM208_g5407 [Fusarium decemcellulare]